MTQLFIIVDISNMSTFPPQFVFSSFRSICVLNVIVYLVYFSTVLSIPFSLFQYKKSNVLTIYCENKSSAYLLYKKAYLMTLNACFICLHLIQCLFPLCCVLQAVSKLRKTTRPLVKVFRIAPPGEANRNSDEACIFDKCISTTRSRVINIADSSLRFYY